MAPKLNPPKKQTLKQAIKQVRNPKRSARVRGGRNPHDGDENYNWFTLKELQAMFGTAGAQMIADDESGPARMRVELNVLEYGLPLDVDDDN